MLVEKMHSEKKYKKMLIYNESCFSGDLGEVISAKTNAFMMAASNKYLSSKAFNCFDDAVMEYKNGKPIIDPWVEGNCINDLFTYNWMQNL